MSNLFSLLKHDSSMPVVAKAAGRQFVNSINFMLITSASQLVREDLRIRPAGDLDAPDLDAYNALLAGRRDAEEEDSQHAEQGFGDGLSLMEKCKYLKSLRNYINEQLHKNATQVKFELSGKVGPNPFEIGDPIEMTLQRQIDRAPRELTGAMKMEAKALGLPEDAILQGLARQQANNTEFLTKHRHTIMEVITKMECAELDEDSVEGMFDKLPAMERFRLWAAADNGLYFSGITQGQRWVLNKVQEGKDNLAIINATRHKVRKDINEFLSEVHNKRAIADAMAAGATPPVLNPLPPTEAELKVEQSKIKSGTVGK